MKSENTKRRILELFEAALLEEPANRAEFLLRACGSNEKLIAEVSSLVAVHEQMHMEDTSPARRALPANNLQQVGRYQVRRELGRGGMGIVYEAHDPVIDRVVALKTILLDGYSTPAEQEWMRERLFREAQSAGALSHPNIVTIYDSGLHEDVAFIAMEYVDGPTLRQRLTANERMERVEALDILRQAAAALDFAHQAGVVHRDIKPSNIMLRQAGACATGKITDFGIAKITRTEQPTRTGLPMGTPEYMSPEQIQGHPVDGRSDQFSLAAVAFEMVTGVKQFQADSVAGLVHQIVYEERSRTAAANLPAAVDEVLDRALAKTGQDRYATCAEFARALEEAFTSPQPMNRPAGKRLATRPPTVRRRWLWAGAGILMFVLLAWFASRSLGPQLAKQATARVSQASHGQAVLHRDFDRLSLRTEAFLDTRPSNPNHDDNAWRIVPAPISGLTGVVAMAAGWGHSLAITKDGSLIAWGWGHEGRLGDNTTANRPVPFQITDRAMAGLVSLAAGNGHNLALNSDGKLWGWGGNDSGQVGDGTTTSRWTPVQVHAPPGAIGVAAGSWHSLAVKSDGNLWAWGRNVEGQLGDGTTINRSIPVQVKGLAGVAAVAAGNVHSLALKGDGSVWAWGKNTDGRLGDGTTTDRLRPGLVAGLSSVVAITAGSHHNLALNRDGSVWAWGPNSYGELGDGTTTARWRPVQIAGLSNVTAIAAGAQHSYALKNDGTVWAWGQNYYGALGDGTTTNRSTPVQVRGLARVVAITAGGQHAIARKSDGSLWTWGWNDYGQLGREPILALDNAGTTTIGQGSAKNTGATYRMTSNGFPWIQFDRNARKVLLHPGKSGTSQWGASLAFDVTADGEYTISGAFQRPLPSVGSANGLDVAVILDTDAANPLWVEQISSAQSVADSFRIRKSLLRGQVIRFIVFKRPEGRGDASDATFLEATIEW